MTRGHNDVHRNRSDDEYQRRHESGNTPHVKGLEVYAAAPMALLDEKPCDQKSGQDEKEIDARPSPQGSLEKPRVLEARMAVVKDDTKNRNAAQSLKLRNVRRKPGWSLDGQRGRLAGENTRPPIGGPGTRFVSKP